MKFSWCDGSLVALLTEFECDWRSISVAFIGDIDGMVQETFAIIYCRRILTIVESISWFLLWEVVGVLVCLSSFELDAFISLESRQFFDVSGGVACGRL